MTVTKSGGRVDGQNFKLVEFKTELSVKPLNLRKSICDCWIEFCASEKQGLRSLNKKT